MWGNPALLFLLWAFWLGAEYLVFGPNSYVRIHDNGAHYLPARLGLMQSVRSGTFGFWAPNWVCGTDRFEQGFMNDFTVLPFLFVPGWIAYGIVMVAQRFLAGYFTFRLLRDELQVDEGAAIYGGLVFALFAQGALTQDWAGFTLYHGFATPGMALFLWLLSRLERRSLIPSMLQGALIGVLLVLTADITHTLFVVPLALFWFWLIVPRRTVRFWVPFTVFLVVWTVVQFVAVLPILQNAAFSNRATFNPDIIWNPVSRFAGALHLVRDNFVPLAVGSLGLAVARWRERRLISIACVLAFCLGMGAFSEILVRPFRSALGFVYAFSWTRFAYLVPLLASAAAAIGIAQLQNWWVNVSDRRSSHTFRASTLALWLLVAFTCAQSLQVKARTLNEMVEGSNFRALFLNPTLQQLAQQSVGSSPARVASIALGNTTLPWPPSAAWAYGFDTADGYLNVQSLRYRNFWEAVIQPLTATDRFHYDWVHSWGNQLYLFAPSNGFPQVDANTPMPVNFQGYYRLDLLTLANVQYVISPIPVADPDLVSISSPERDEQIAWVKRSRYRRLLDMLMQHAPGMALYVYRNNQQLPRAFCAPLAKSFATPQQLFTALSQATTAELGSTAFFESSNAASAIELGRDSQAGSVTALQYSGDTVSLAVDTQSTCALVLTDSYSPYWKAQLDGHPTQLFPVDIAFQGLIVHPGQHKLVLDYAPPYALN